MSNSYFNQTLVGRRSLSNIPGSIGGMGGGFQLNNNSISGSLNESHNPINNTPGRQCGFSLSHENK
jgi:hypothetical protein